MSKSTLLENNKVNTKIKLAGLWITLMLLYIYGDFFSLMTPDRIQNLINGKMGLGTTTPIKLLIASILMAVPALMVSLCLSQKTSINRVLNIIFGFFYTLVMMLVVYTSISYWMTFYVFLGVLEIIISLIIVWTAWKWPKIEESIV